MEYFKCFKNIKNILFLFEYHSLTWYQKIKKSWIYQTLLSRMMGLSIAQKVNHSIHLRYIYDGIEYEIYLPLDNRLKSRMTNQSIEVQDHSNLSRKIKQQTGIPFLVTANQIGVEKIVLTKLDDENIFIENQKVFL